MILAARIEPDAVISGSFIALFAVLRTRPIPQRGPGDLGGFRVAYRFMRGPDGASLEPSLGGPRPRSGRGTSHNNAQQGTTTKGQSRRSEAVSRHNCRSAQHPDHALQAGVAGSSPVVSTTKVLVRGYVDQTPDEAGTGP